MTSQQGEQLHNFASTTVHHLREPVRMITVYTELLLSASKGSTSSEAGESVDFLRKACLQMQQLLDGLSEFAAATIVRPRPDTRIRLELALRQALLNLHAELQAPDANVTFANLPTVLGDFDGLQIVFQHLIRNAVQYREPNRRPEITIRARRTAPEWLVEVADNGPGVAPEFREKIFELYRRLHGKAIPGNGLGLPVCRAIIEAHGGRIWVEQGRESGATFVFTLPVDPLDESEVLPGDA